MSEGCVRTSCACVRAHERVLELGRVAAPPVSLHMSVCACARGCVRVRASNCFTFVPAPSPPCLLPVQACTPPHSHAGLRR